MRQVNRMAVVGCVLIAGICGYQAEGAPRKAGKEVASKEESTPLTPAGEKLQTRYEEMLAGLKAAITKELPVVDEQKKSAFLKAYQDEVAASRAALGAVRKLGDHKLKDKSEAEKNIEVTKTAWSQVVAKAEAPAKAVLGDLAGVLSSEALDAQLVKFEVLTSATPKGLAAYAQQGKEQEALIESLLSNEALMKQMVVAGGVEGGKYGRTMEIYTAIQKASPKAKDGVLQRLALGTALELAVPVGQDNPAAVTNGPAVVDPVKRYLHFEAAYLNGELDPGFKQLTAWDFRNVVNGNEPDECLTWGRQMLHNYRPDHIVTPDTRWRYVKTVKTDVKYGSADQKFDSPTNYSYQNMLMTGGVCGRRAFFGGFILRSFGIPIVRRPQSGHAALAHWTPDGWVVNLGAGWEWGWTRYGEGVDFATFTAAQKDEKGFLAVLRAKWMGDVAGETRVFGMHEEASGFWNAVALYQQKAIIEKAKAVALAAVGQDIAEANESKEKDVVVKVELTEADKAITVAADGTITIPAVACKNTSTNTATLVFMESNLGGKQMHYERVSKPAPFEYTVDVPKAGKYALTGRIVTVNLDQKLLVKANEAKEPVTMVLPYTKGMWQKSEPVELVLEKGTNVLKFDRPADYRGLTIKDFTLTPVR